MDIKLAFYKIIFIQCFLSVVSFDTLKFHYEDMSKKLNAKKSLDYRRLLKQPSQDYLMIGPEYPRPLPETTTTYIRSPYERIYQGYKRKGDLRVYNKKFEYEPDPYRGQNFFSEGLFECIITHLSVETAGGTPILLRGGVGYRHFSIMCKAKRGHSLIGHIRAYCKKPEDIHGQYVQAPQKNFIKLLNQPV